MNPAESPAETEVETEGHPSAAASPLPAGAVRIPRNRLVAMAVLGAVTLIAAAGVVTGMSRARRADLDGGDAIRVEAGKLGPTRGVAQATPILPLAGPEPGSDPIGAPVGDATPDTGPAILSKPAEGPGLAPGSVQPADRRDDTARDEAARQPSTPDDAAPSTPDRADARPPVVAAAAGDRTASACLAPKTHVQQVICADPHLATVDRRLRRAYQQALANTDDPDALSVRQAQWLAARDRAANRGDAGALSELYAERLRELEPQ